MSAADERSQPHGQPRRDISHAERAIDRAFSTGKADRAAITRQAQLDAAEAVAKAGMAMESDEAARLTVIAANVANSVVAGSFSLLGTVLGNLYYLFLLLYFARSDRVRAVLVNDLSTEHGIGKKDDFVIVRGGWPFYRNLGIYFVVFSVLGHWMEAAMCQLIRLGLVQGEYDASNTMLWRDWLYPYPMEGAAVVLIALLLHPLYLWLKKRCRSQLVAHAISFAANALTCTVIEFVGGVLFNARHQNWDYSDMPFNFMGQVCLQNALAFGVAASLIAWYVYPALERAIARVRPAVMNVVFVVVIVAGGILFSLYAIAPPEGIDLGATQQEQADPGEDQQERDAIDSSIELLDGLMETTQEAVDGATSLTEDERKEITDHLGNARDELGKAREVFDDA